jgi:hypothetical protein
MSVYSVYVPRETPLGSPDGVDAAVTVRERFTFTAFLLPLPWLVYARAWLALLVFMALTFGINAIGTQMFGLGPEAVAPLDLVIALYIGFAAPDIRGRALERRKMRLADVVIADDADAALHRFAESWLAGRSATTRPGEGADISGRSITPATGPVIGLFPEAGR